MKEIPWKQPPAHANDPNETELRAGDLRRALAQTSHTSLKILSADQYSLFP